VLPDGQLAALGDLLAQHAQRAGERHHGAHRGAAGGMGGRRAQRGHRKADGGQFQGRVFHLENLHKVNSPQTAATDLSRMGEGIEAFAQHRMAIRKTAGKVIWC